MNSSKFSNLRLDIFIKLKYSFSREYAQYLIKNGAVKINEKIVLKPGIKVLDNDIVYIDKEKFLKYVSKGGLKLEKAINEFSVSFCNKVCIDVGASTGGFTDCMLQNGATKVFAVDVGSNQLSNYLKDDKRVISLENTNIKDLKSSDFDCNIDFAVIDVSFISLDKVLLNVRNIIKEEGEIIALIKPQFEAGKSNIGKNGIVKNLKVHEKVIYNICRFCFNAGLGVFGITFSPNKGGSGNIEYLIYLKKDKKGFDYLEIDKLVKSVVLESHNTL